jgi:hypothetical protein
LPPWEPPSLQLPCFGFLHCFSDDQIILAAPIFS